MKLSVTKKQALKTMVILVAIFACSMQETEAQTIVANEDVAFMSRYGSSGGFNVLSNDLLNGIPVGPSQVIITLTAPDPNGYLVLNTVSGALNIPVTAPPGTYSLTYTICDVNNPSICDDAVVTVHAINAPVVTVGNIVTTAPTASVVITAADISNFGSCNLQLNYDPAVATAISIVKAPGIPGNITSAVLTPGEVRCGWYTSPGIFFPDDTPVFMINFEKVSNGTTEITWDQSYNQRMSDGYSRSFVMTPFEDYFFDGSLTFVSHLVELNLFLEGLYNPTNGNMNKAKDFDGTNIIDKYAGTIADMITVELRDPVNYNTVILQVNNIPLHQDGSAGFVIEEPLAGSYYITIKTRNHLETVSAMPVSFNDMIITYDFRNAASQAYGNNMKELEPGIWGIYAGDVNQDGIINLSDREPVNDDYLITKKGYFPEDINGDGFINLSDREIINDAYLQTITAKTP